MWLYAVEKCINDPNAASIGILWLVTLAAAETAGQPLRRFVMNLRLLSQGRARRSPHNYP
jgi:hypothetical protein